MHISNIRAKIGDDSKNPKYIKSIWGIGYKFVAQNVYFQKINYPFYFNLYSYEHNWSMD